MDETPLGILTHPYRKDGNQQNHTMQKTTLYFREGNSDKIYQATLEPQAGGYVVNFAYGRRGSTLTTGTKTRSPLPLLEATEIYDRLILSKTAKGYTHGEDGTPYVAPATHKCGQCGAMNHIVNECRCDPNNLPTKLPPRPQLLNSVEESGINLLLLNPSIVLQEKHDGRRMLLRKTDGVVTAFNKKGQPAGLPATIEAEAKNLGSDFLMDGEAVGDTFHAFDLLELNGRDLRESSYGIRLLNLQDLILDTERSSIQLTVTSLATPLKKKLFLEQMRRDGAEGVVFKDLNAMYSAGRPNSGGDQLKFKFVASASVLVEKVNAKRSVRIALYRGEKLVPAGNVTIPPNQPIPKAGDVAEVRYLYAISGALYQPVYLGVRDDVDAAECLADQLKYKAAA